MVSVKEASKTSMWKHYEDVSQLLQEGVLFKGCDTFAMEFPQVLAAMEGRPCAILENFARSLPEVRLSELVSLNAVALSPWGRRSEAFGGRSGQLFCVGITGWQCWPAPIRPPRRCEMIWPPSIFRLQPGNGN